MKLRITVENKTYEVEVEVLDDGGAPSTGFSGIKKKSPPRASQAAAAAPAPSAPAPAASAPSAGSDSAFPSPLAGKVFKVQVKPGDSVKTNQELIVLEAMKMETSISSPQDGVIKSVLVNVGDAVQSGTPLLEFE